MNELLNDWLMFSEGLREFEKSHFLGLFKSELDQDQLRSIFSDGPTGAELHRRTKEVLDASILDDCLYFQPKSPADPVVLVSAAKAWLEELAVFCGGRGNTKLQGIAEGARIAIRDRQSFRLPKDPDTPAGWMLRPAPNLQPCREAGSRECQHLRPVELTNRLEAVVQ